MASPSPFSRLILAWQSRRHRYTQAPSTISSYTSSANSSASILPLAEVLQSDNLCEEKYIDFFAEGSARLLKIRGDEEKSAIDADEHAADDEVTIPLSTLVFEKETGAAKHMTLPPTSLRHDLKQEADTKTSQEQQRMRYWSHHSQARLAYARPQRTTSKPSSRRLLRHISFADLLTCCDYDVEEEGAADPKSVYSRARLRSLEKKDGSQAFFGDRRVGAPVVARPVIVGPHPSGIGN